MKKLAILVVFIIIGQNVFLPNIHASLGRIAEYLLKRTIKKQYTLPSKFKEIVSPKRVGGFFHWIITLSPILKLLDSSKSTSDIIYTSGIPLDKKTKNIIQKETGKNSDNIKSLMFTDNDCTDGEFVYLSGNTINKLNSKDSKEVSEGMAVYLHEDGRIKNKDYKNRHVKNASAYVEGIIGSTAAGKIIKKIKKPLVFGYGYIRSIFNGKLTAIIKGSGGVLNILRKKRDAEYAADNIQHENPATQFKSLDGLERFFLNNNKRDQSALWRKKYPELLKVLSLKRQG